MAFILRCIQYMVTSVLQDQQYMFGVSCSLVDKKVLKKKDLADVFFRQLMQWLLQLCLLYSLTGVCQ